MAVQTPWQSSSVAMMPPLRTWRGPAREAGVAGGTGQLPTCPSQKLLRWSPSGFVGAAAPAVVVHQLLLYRDARHHRRRDAPRSTACQAPAKRRAARWRIGERRRSCGRSSRPVDRPSVAGPGHRRSPFRADDRVTRAPSSTTAWAGARRATRPRGRATLVSMSFSMSGRHARRHGGAWGRLPEGVALERGRRQPLLENPQWLALPTPESGKAGPRAAVDERARCWASPPTRRGRVADARGPVSWTRPADAPCASGWRWCSPSRATWRALGFGS